MQGSERTSPERMVYIGVGLVFALLLAGYIVYKAAVVVLVLLLTILFSIIMSAPVDYLSRRGIGRGLGTLLVLGGFVLLFGLAGAALVPIIEDQASEFVDTFPALLENVQQLVVGLQSALVLKTSFNLDPQNVLDRARNFLSGGALTTVASVGASVATVLSFRS